MGSKDEMDGAMAVSVEVDEALRAEERHLKSEQFSKETMVRARPPYSDSFVANWTNRVWHGVTGNDP
jgi:hypothetical protein